jgi:hypothetical protein
MGNNVLQVPASSVVFHAEDDITGYPETLVFSASSG